jgi:hypothetical protein
MSGWCICYLVMRSHDHVYVVHLWVFSMCCSWFSVLKRHPSIVASKVVGFGTVYSYRDAAPAAVAGAPPVLAPATLPPVSNTAADVDSEGDDAEGARARQLANEWPAFRSDASMGTEMSDVDTDASDGEGDDPVPIARIGELAPL